MHRFHSFSGTLRGDIDFSLLKPSDFRFVVHRFLVKSGAKGPKSVLRSWRFLGICAEGGDRIFIMTRIIIRS